MNSLLRVSQRREKANFRQRPLLTVDEVVTPQIGNCTIFARYVEPAFATQVILTARLTRLYEREDWQARFAASKNQEPLLLERGVSVNVQPTFTQTEPPKQAKKNNPDPFAEAAKQRMAEAKTGKAQVSDSAKALAQHGRIELENFLALEVKRVDRGERTGTLLIGGKLRHVPRYIKRLVVMPSKSLKKRLSTR